MAAVPDALGAIGLVAADDRAGPLGQVAGARGHLAGRLPLGRQLDDPSLAAGYRVTRLPAARFELGDGEVGQDGQPAGHAVALLGSNRHTAPGGTTDSLRGETVGIAGH